jgi:hypothetical protein
MAQATPTYNTELAEENCTFYDTIAHFDIWMTPTQEIILQFSERPSDYACMPFWLAKRTDHPNYKAAVAVIELHHRYKR